MIERTREQHETLSHAGHTLRARDPVSSVEYVLVPANLYERIKAILIEDSEWAEQAYRASMEAFARDGWDDPEMDAYNALDPRIKS